jgi:L-lysine 2,3-aminomutase
VGWLATAAGGYPVQFFAWTLPGLIAKDKALSETLFEAGVLPYYLHLLDPVAGAAHFDVPEATARSLLGEIAALLPGYLVPRLVREIPGETSKTMLPPASR